jgi:hypothetical protein
MKKKKIILLIVTVLLGCLVTAFFFFIDAKRSRDFTKGMFPLWDGSQIKLFPPYKSDVACIIQCEPMRLEWEGGKKSRTA